MKKISLLFSFMFLLALSHEVQAQNYSKAIGLRFGYPFSIDYKFFTGGANAIELYAGTRYDGFTLGAMYEVHKPFTDVDGLMWYYGAGALVSFYSYYEGDNETSFGINGVIGLDYTFPDAPFNLSLDFMPAFMFGGYYDGYESWGGLSARYVLN